jgi:hypothetical protein
MLRSVTVITLSALATFAKATPHRNAGNFNTMVSGKRNETRASEYAKRAAAGDKNDPVRVIHGSGSGWPADDDFRMMRPYWEAQDAGGQLVIIRAASGPLLDDGSGGGDQLYVDVATDEIVRKLRLDFEELPLVRGDCRTAAFDDETIARVRNAAGIYFGGGMPGRVVSCLLGHQSTEFGLNAGPDDTTPLLEARARRPAAKSL